MRNLIIAFVLVLSGCVLHTVTFMSPRGLSGNATINGCGQIPSTFQYQMEDAKYQISLSSNSVYLVVEVVDGSKVQWLNNQMQVWVNDKTYNLKVSELIKDDRVREPCGGFTESLNCKSYRRYYLNVEVDAIEGATQLKVRPPAPSVNNNAFEVSEIEYKEVTKTLMQAINC